MKHILDQKFIYRRAIDTDLRKTFDRVRREQARAKAETAQKVVATIKPHVRGKL